MRNSSVKIPPIISGDGVGLRYKCVCPQMQKQNLPKLLRSHEQLVCAHLAKTIHNLPMFLLLCQLGIARPEWKI